jgi:hypothetical protein
MTEIIPAVSPFQINETTLMGNVRMEGAVHVILEAGGV